MSNIPPPPPGSPGQPQYPPTQQFPAAPDQPQPAYGPPGSQPPAGPGGYGGPPPGGGGGGGLPGWAWVLGAVVLIGLGIGAFFLFSGDDDEEASDSTDEVVTDETDSDLTLPVGTGDTDFTLPNLTTPDLSIPDITTPTDFTVPDISTGGDLFDQLRDQLITIGLSEEQADCVIEEAIDLGMNSGGEEPDMNEVFDLYEECGVDLGDLQPGG